MGSYDDPRYLQTVIEDLEARLAKVEDSTMPLAIHQKGPLPGVMRAVTIGDPGLGSSMWINLNGNKAGTAPYSAVTDANKTVRAEWGNLAANGNSPAQFGFRANDASGSPLFDSLGLVKSMTVVGSATAQGTGAIVGGNGSWQTVSGTSVSITVPRTLTYFVPASILVVASTLGDTGYTLQSAVLVDGSYSASNGPSVYNIVAAGSGQSMTPFAVVSLTAGTHTVALGVNMTNTHNWSVGSGSAYIYAIQLGS